MIAARENVQFLPGHVFPPNLEATNDLEQALRGAAVVVAVTPSHTMRAVMTRAAPHLPADAPIVSATKGIENDTLMTMSEVLEEVVPAARGRLAFLSGPSFAKEVARGVPTAVTVASRDAELARRVQALFSTPTFRVYTSDDVVGVELGGALKNVIAIAAGIVDGLEYGDNTRAALITRGLHEMARLAMKRGANPLTLAALAGMGDLVLTCTGELSRNRSVGVALGRGRKLEEILGEMKAVAEGVKTAKSVHDLATREGVEMPICEQVYRILYENRDPREAVAELMGRPPRGELEHY
jgi:glycerol-3-phosphate dehydrogenase (NAD(P)+)